MNLIDPAGKFPSHCQYMSSKAEYEKCVLNNYDLEPIDPNNLGATVEGTRGCYDGPNSYRAPGYIEGLSFSAGGNYVVGGGIEMVYDFATWQRAVFKYHGAGVTDSSSSFSDYQYVGIVQGFKVSVVKERQYSIVNDYGGQSDSKSLGISPDGPLTPAAGYSWSRSYNDPLIRAKTFYMGATLGLDYVPGMDFSRLTTDYSLFSYVNVSENYILPGGVVDTARLVSNISSGADSPWMSGGLLFAITPMIRAKAVTYALKYHDAYQAIRFQEILGW